MLNQEDKSRLSIPTSENSQKAIPKRQLLAPASRRTVLSKSLGIGGAVGAWSIIRGAKTVKADGRHNDHEPTGIDPNLRTVLDFRRENSKDMMVVFGPTSALAGFGNHLFHYELTTSTGLLLFQGEKVIAKSSDTQHFEIKEEGRLQVGDKFTHSLILETIDGRASFSDITVEAIPDVESKNSGGDFTGSTFRISLEVGVPDSPPTFQSETIYDLLFDVFPEGVFASGEFPPIDPIIGHLLDIAAHTFARETERSLDRATIAGGRVFAAPAPEPVCNNVPGDPCCTLTRTTKVVPAVICLTRSMFNPDAPVNPDPNSPGAVCMQIAVIESVDTFRCKSPTPQRQALIERLDCLADSGSENCF